ncbi:hypothetical protein C9374_013442 [Naegleria lovaniensis]|uniref:protein acetyllysine N-acetyltransferase n=1 Tax=Naegleria lovaniensis TaxID=51637 RepID=A0AA88KQ57_NAELO|nr:uncharacterized protein C9374_013442 [Naegleria lovaniensis]KAG2391957.1 hypothetical protein C9374_013442 [Naegleria lovaniensis]
MPTPSTEIIYDKSGNDITEYYDSPQELDAKIEQLAKLIHSSKHIVFYTGAGISTSAGISDFRGPKGVWTLKEKGLKTTRTASYLNVPTPTHMAISYMYNQKKIQYVTSQNTDGLHVKSGIKRSDMSELHDSIINFGENLPVDQLERAELNARKADLAIVMGTSLRVSPACDLPQKCKKNHGKLVIVNLQYTPKDKYADIRIFAKTDTVINKLMEKLGYTIPPYILNCEYTLQAVEKSSGKSRKINVVLSSPQAGANLLSSTMWSVTLENGKVMEYNDVSQLMDLPNDVRKVTVLLTFRLQPKEGVEAETVIELDIPHQGANTSKTFHISVNTNTNDVTCK